MSVIHMTSTYVFAGTTYTTGNNYQLRAKDVETLVALNKGTKSSSIKSKKK